MTLPYPSSSGGLEKIFIENVDLDGQVDSFLKINEYNHTFVNIKYIREDGLIARYFPDFIVKINDNIYIVETKADKDVSSYNVQAKRKATLKYLQQVNELPKESRMNSKWNYVLLKKSALKRMLENKALIKEILDYSILTEAKIKGTLDDLLGD
ncbi:MAG: hypothetical protein LBC39_08415 [Methanobrevibacter sp.]|jgi:type III restriction enzyme|nr:hypothetical protein [Candidatus Methanovirga aequatorialis]